MREREKTCCFTGHRQIAAEHRALLEANLEQLVRKLVSEGICDFIAGGARGFDTLAAQTVLRLRDELPQMRLLLALPCRDQTRGWSKEETAQYLEIAKLADGVNYLAEAYDSTCMLRRNRYMVDHSAACIFYLTRTRSGTYQTVSYAMERGHTLYNILCPN